MCLAVVGPAIATDGPARISIAKVDKLVRSLGYGQPDAPGLSLGVVLDGKLLLKRAYGLADLEAKTLITSKTNFRLASVTKQFTAMAVLMLMEEGKLRLDSRLSDFFPEFPAYGRDITILEMLHHTSGLPDYDDLVPKDRTEQLNDHDVLDILERQTSNQFTPGSKFQYSNSGYVLLGMIVAKASGESYPKFLKERIFTPLGMIRTLAYVKGQAGIPSRAYGHSPSEEGFRRTDQSVTSATLGDGGIYSSVEDMYKWDQALYTEKLVSAQSLESAFRSGTFGLGAQSGYGMGWFVAYNHGFRTLSHTGSTLGFRSAIMRIPQKNFCVIVLMNRGDGNPVAIANAVAKLVNPDFSMAGE